MRKIHFIVNPNATKGKTKIWWENFLPRLEEINAECSWEYTVASRSCIESVQDIAYDYDVFVSIGGDGTAQEMITGLMKSGADPIVVPWPCGTGCDFGRMFREVHDADTLVRILNDNKVENIDVLHIKTPKEEVFGLNVFNIGFSATVGARCNTTILKHLGPICFVLQVFITLFIFKSLKITATVDGVEDPMNTREITLFTVGNGKYIGAGMMICPNAEYNDGVAHVVSARGMNKLEILKCFPKLIAGKHLDMEAIRHMNGKSIILHSDTEMISDIDGEVYTSCDFEINVLEGKLKILV